MKNNHVPALWGFTSLVVFLLVVPKNNDIFTAKEIFLALSFGVLSYAYAIIFELGKGKK